MCKWAEQGPFHFGHECWIDKNKISVWGFNGSLDNPKQKQSSENVKNFSGGSLYWKIHNYGSFTFKADDILPLFKVSGSWRKFVLIFRKLFILTWTTLKSQFRYEMHNYCQQNVLFCSEFERTSVNLLLWLRGHSTWQYWASITYIF